MDINDSTFVNSVSVAMIAAFRSEVSGNDDRSSAKLTTGLSKQFPEEFIQGNAGMFLTNSWIKPRLLRQFIAQQQVSSSSSPSPTPSSISSASSSVEESTPGVRKRGRTQVKQELCDDDIILFPSPNPRPTSRFKLCENPDRTVAIDLTSDTEDCQCDDDGNCEL